MLELGAGVTPRDARSARTQEDGKLLPDLVLLDIMMPGMSGYEVCGKIRELFPKTPIPIIMISAKASEDAIVKGLKAGSNDYMTKPFQRAEILARIETRLRLKELWKIEADHRATNQLLRKILPESIIDRLKQGQKMIADSHESVSVLFSDVVNFTELASQVPTNQIILLLNDLFSEFDRLVDKHGVYKGAPRPPSRFLASWRAPAGPASSPRGP